MRHITELAAGMLLVLFGMGAAASNSGPATKPADLWKDVKPNMTEAEALSALEKAGVKVARRWEKKNTRGEPITILRLDDWRRVSINKAGKVYGIERNNLALNIPPELQQDIKPGMSMEEATTALAKSGVKVIDKGKIGDHGESWILDDGRFAGFMDAEIYTIQKLKKPATKPAS